MASRRPLHTVDAAPSSEGAHFAALVRLLFVDSAALHVLVLVAKSFLHVCVCVCVCVCVRVCEPESSSLAVRPRRLRQRQRTGRRRRRRSHRRRRRRPAVVSLRRRRRPAAAATTTTTTTTTTTAAAATTTAGRVPVESGRTPQSDAPDSAAAAVALRRHVPAASAAARSGRSHGQSQYRPGQKRFVLSPTAWFYYPQKEPKKRTQKRKKNAFHSRRFYDRPTSINRLNRAKCFFKREVHRIRGSGGACARTGSLLIGFWNCFFCDGVHDRPVSIN